MHSSPPKTVFWGDRASEFSNRFFARILETPAELRGVMDSPPRSAVSTNPSRCDLGAGGTRDFFEYAKQAGIPARKPRNPNSAATCDWLRRLAPDLFISVGFFGILKSEVLSIPRLGAVNFHASLLPAYRGKHPVFWALFHGEQRTGITAHLMSERIDEGEIVYQRSVPIRARDTVATLYARVIEAGLLLVDRLVAEAMQGKIPRKPQSTGEASYFSSPTNDHLRINWTMPAQVIEVRVRAAAGKCFFECGGQRIHVLQVSLCRDKGRDKPLQPEGFVVRGQRLQVGTPEGRLWLDEVLADGIPMTGKAWYEQAIRAEQTGRQ